MAGKMDLYSKKILSLATEISLVGSLENPQASIKSRAPLCGSTIKVDLCIKDSEIIDFRHEVRACALGQASASILSKTIIGTDISDILLLKKQVTEMLQCGAEPPGKPFQEFSFLQPAKDFKNRHDSILLPLNAIEKAIKKLSQ